MKEWMTMLLCSVCVITMLLHLLPDGKFVKYVRFYAGLIFILVALDPLLDLILKKEELTRFLQLRFLQEDYSDLSGTISNLSELKNSQILSSYQGEISRQMTQIAELCTGEVADAQVTFSDDGYTPVKVVIRLFKTDSQSESFETASQNSISSTHADANLSSAMAIRREFLSLYALDAKKIIIFDTGGASI